MKPLDRLRATFTAAVIGLGLAVSGCALLPVTPSRASTIDGFPLGEAIPCDSRAQCDVWVPLARAALDARDPGHAPITNASAYAEDFQNTDVYANQSDFRARTEGFVIIVFDLADGSKRATGVLCGVSGCSGTGTYPH